MRWDDMAYEIRWDDIWDEMRDEKRCEIWDMTYEMR